MTLFGLPLELLHLVVEYADGPTRASLARTCHSLNTAVTPYLYQSADIKQGRSNEFIQTISNKHADLVQDVKVVVEGRLRDRISPCRIVPCLKKLKNLRSLQLTGGYWMWDDTREKGEKWESLERLLSEYLESLSLRVPSEARVSHHLRSLTIDRYENNNEGAFLDFYHVFIIPQLRDLTLRGFMLGHIDHEMGPVYERETQLKSLRLERSFVCFPVLAAVLRIPRALKYLSIGHAEDFQMHETDSLEENTATLDDFMDILLLHRESLEGIKVVREEVYARRSGRPQRDIIINHPSFQSCASQFPKLKRWEGFDSLSMITFLGKYRC
ncbi:hypothetical protein N7528_003834 [Penicillium herquei]|nr:hypothetical protein N7528_003834 [Penicillium herquei]